MRNVLHIVTNVCNIDSVAVRLASGGIDSRPTPYLDKI